MCLGSKSVEELIPLDADKKRRKSKANFAKRRAQSRMEDGLCVACGKNPLFTKRLCSECREKSKSVCKRAKLKLKALREQNGLCDCGKPRDGAGKECQECRDRRNERRLLREADRDKLGLCRKCGKHPRVSGTACERCSVYAISKHTLKRGKNAWENVNELFQLLINDQKRLCPYTGLKLYVGLNASIDHKIPQSKGGSHDLENLAWVHKWANNAKSFLLEEEFLEMVELVATYRLGMVKK